MIWKTSIVLSFNKYLKQCLTTIKGEHHTFALKRSPGYYVFYIDGEPTWASMGGGVSKVKEFLRLTVEIDAGDGWGPHGQEIGQFDDKSESVFYIDYVKVWQN